MYCIYYNTISIFENFTGDGVDGKFGVVAYS